MIQAVLLFHISIALASIGYTTYLFVAPTRSKFPTAYTLVGLTIASGTYLIISLPAHMAEVCVTGLTYIALVSIGIVAARNRLMKTEKRLH